MTQNKDSMPINPEQLPVAVTPHPRMDAAHTQMLNEWPAGDSADNALDDRIRTTFHSFAAKESVLTSETEQRERQNTLDKIAQKSGEVTVGNALPSLDMSAEEEVNRALVQRFIDRQATRTQVEPPKDQKPKPIRPSTLHRDLNRGSHGK